MRQMTFEIPDEVAEQFSANVPASEQSSIVTKLLRSASRPKLTEGQWDAICQTANNDPETQQIQREMAALPDPMAELWNTDLASARRRERDLMLERACDALEGDADLELLAIEMDALNDDSIAEPSHVSEAR